MLRRSLLGVVSSSSWRRIISRSTCVFVPNNQHHEGGNSDSSRRIICVKAQQRRWIQSTKGERAPTVEGEIVDNSVKQNLQEAIERMALIRSTNDSSSNSKSEIQVCLEKIRNIQFQLEEWEKSLETEQELHETYYSSDPLALAKSHNRFGILYQNLFDFPRSQHHFEQSLSYYQQLYPESFDAQVGDAWVALAVLAAEQLDLSRAMQHLDCAEPHYRYCGQKLYGSLSLDDETPTPPHHPKLRTVLEHKGEILRMWNQHKQALELYQEIRDKMLNTDIDGEDDHRGGIIDLDVHLDMADCILTIGEDLEEAQRLYQLVLTNLRRTDEEETIRGAAVHHQLGLVYARRQDQLKEKALYHFDMAHRLRQRLLGDVHALVGQTINAMGAVQAALSNPSAALSNFRQALMIARINTEFPQDEDDPEIKQILQNIKIVQRDMEKTTFHVN